MCVLIASATFSLSDLEFFLKLLSKLSLSQMLLLLALHLQPNLELQLLLQCLDLSELFKLCLCSHAVAQAT